MTFFGRGKKKKRILFPNKSHECYLGFYRWALIAGRIPGRKPEEIERFWIMRQEEGFVEKRLKRASREENISVRNGWCQPCSFPLRTHLMAHYLFTDCLSHTIYIFAFFIFFVLVYLCHKSQLVRCTVSWPMLFVPLKPFARYHGFALVETKFFVLSTYIIISPDMHQMRRLFYLFLM